MDHYIVVTAMTHWGIARKVNKKIKEGYEPLGNVTGVTCRQQSMIKRDKNSNAETGRKK